MVVLMALSYLALCLALDHPQLLVKKTVLDDMVVMKRIFNVSYEVFNAGRRCQRRFLRTQ